MRRRSPLQRVLIYLAAILLAIFWFGPFVLVGIGSIIPEGNLVAVPPRWFDSPPYFGNFNYILTGTIPAAYEAVGGTRSMISNEVRYVPGAILNSILVATAVMFVNLILGSLAAYAFSHLRFPGRAGLFNFILLSRLIPAVALAVPYYIIIQNLGLLNSYWALIAIYSVLTLPFTILVLTIFFRAVPVEIDEAAQLEGASPWRVLRDIIVPLSLPSLVGTGLFAFMLAYGEFLFALLITTSVDRRTLPVILATISGNPDVSWGLLMASITLGTIPTLILAIPVWRFMIRGLTAGAGR